MTKIKICGLTSLRDAFYACDMGADALGFVFAKSPRRISSHEAEQIIKKLPPYVSTVGVFVDEKPEDIMRIAFTCHLTAIQLHGKENSKNLLSYAPVKTIKAFQISGKDSLKAISSFPHADAFLLDTFVEGKAGGTGKTFNWAFARAAAKKYDTPVILAGGLTPRNVGDAVKKVKPYAVDVSSGVEKSPGVKDPKKIKMFVSAVRKAR